MNSDDKVSMLQKLHRGELVELGLLGEIPEQPGTKTVESTQRGYFAQLDSPDEVRLRKAAMGRATPDELDRMVGSCEPGVLLYSEILADGNLGGRASYIPVEKIAYMRTQNSGFLARMFGIGGSAITWFEDCRVS